ncbi:TlpA family protein disulfide reductase [Candidatus Bathyarchaeota archaeon]|nr:TlpA family protein disulfide reductase [Candidatus Bathyarchaeota archaeon]
MMFTFSKFLQIALILCLFSPMIDQVESNDKAQDFQLKDIDGNTFSLSDFKGKVVVLEFFASKCGPCKPQLMELREIRSAYPEDQVKIISVSFDPRADTDEVLRDLAKNVSVTWIMARDTIGIADVYGADMAPTTYLIDRAGNIRYVSPGLTKSDRLMPKIDELVSEPFQPDNEVATDSGNTGLILLLIIIIIALAIFIIRKRKSSRRKERRHSHR